MARKRNMKYCECCKFRPFFYDALENLCYLCSINDSKESKAIRSITLCGNTCLSKVSCIYDIKQQIQLTRNSVGDTILINKITKETEHNK